MRSTGHSPSHSDSTQDRLLVQQSEQAWPPRLEILTWQVGYDPREDEPDEEVAWPREP